MKDSQSVGDTPPEEFRKQLHELADWIADFREHLEQLRVAPNDNPGTLRAKLPERAPEEAEPFAKILSDVDRIIVPGMVHWSHPMFLGYFGWTSTAPGILGEILSAPLNVNAMTWRTCPAATELETAVIDWLREWIGLSDEFDGVVYDTASVGIMHALAVAREDAAPATRKLGLTDRDLPRFRIYISDQAHSAAEKAAIALGLGEENVIRVPSDDQFRMDVNSLGHNVAQDRQNGFQPMAVVATVGTTATASVDAIPEIAKICREENRLANLFAGWIKKDDRFELSAEPSMGVVCFRFIGADEKKLDQLNSNIVERINASGRAYLTQTKLRGRTVIRIGLGNVLTTEEHLRKGWEIIQETASNV